MENLGLRNEHADGKYCHAFLYQNLFSKEGNLLFGSPSGGPSSAGLLCYFRHIPITMSVAPGCLQTAANEGELLISPIAFAEFAIAYPEVAVAQADLDLLHIFFDSITPAAAYLAGQIFLRYRCNEGLRLNLIPDFLIAAHTSIQADRLAAVDRGYFRYYLPIPGPSSGVDFCSFPSSEGSFNEAQGSKTERAKIPDFRT